MGKTEIADDSYCVIPLGDKARNYVIIWNTIFKILFVVFINIIGNSTLSRRTQCHRRWRWIYTRNMGSSSYSLHVSWSKTYGDGIWSYSFSFGIVFFLYRIKQITIYVSIFAFGHSSTMLLGVIFGWGVNAYIVDAIIGFSVVYKSLDNLRAYQRWFGFQPNTKFATLILVSFMEQDWQQRSSIMKLPMMDCY